MAIYNIFDYYEKEVCEKVGGDRGSSSSFYLHSDSETTDQNYIRPPEDSTKKNRLFSALCARFFFFLLLIADVFWGLYTVICFTMKATLCLLTFFRLPALKKSTAKSLLNMRRSLICLIALFIALFSPGLGIMFSCMYFLMYDKSGVEEVVPASLREQFQSIFAMNGSM